MTESDVTRWLTVGELAIIAFVASLALFALVACGEKPCNREGSTKADNGVLYTCADRGTGSGLRWYKS